MHRSRTCLLSTSLLVPVALVLAAAAPAAAEPPSSTFGSHVSACAQSSTGFGPDHNPSHHRGPSGSAMDMHC